MNTKLDRAFAELQSRIVKRVRGRKATFFDNVARADGVVSCSEAADRCQAIKAVKKTSATKMRILYMIDRRTGGPGLRSYRTGLRNTGSWVPQ